MKTILVLTLAIVLTWFTSLSHAAPPPVFRALALYNLRVEKGHVQFAADAIAFYIRLAKDKNFDLDISTDWNDLNAEKLAKYQVVIWLNDSPHNQAQRTAFEEYMEHGGAWLGCHVAGYNDKDSHWPWFVQFLGGAVFYTNNWPPMPGKVIVDTNKHPATANLPTEYESPANEFYQFIPSPRLNKDVTVLVTLDPANYPFGKKDLITSGDVPIVWTNNKYKMIYINMGHGDKVMTSDIQNRLYADAIMWLGKKETPATQPATAPAP